MRYPLSVFLLFMVFSTEASMQSNYEKGHAFAESEKLQLQKALAETKPSQVPGFKTETPPESHLDQHGNFEDALRGALSQNEAAKQVMDNAKMRPRVVIDPKTDPLFKAGSERSPEDILNIPGEPEALKVEGPTEKNVKKEERPFVMNVLNIGM